MPKLSYLQRKHLRSSEFAIPQRRAYPIENRSHARNALSRVETFGTPSEKKQVRAAVHRKYPELGKKDPPKPRQRDYSLFGALDNLMNNGDYF